MCIENKVSSQGIHYLRYLMSWVNSGGDFNSDHYWDDRGQDKWKGVHGFQKWLETLGLNEEEIKEMFSMAGMGKLELEYSARKFIKGS